MAEPVLKWVGGKRQLLADITSRFPVSYNTYHEPFIGGGGVFFALEPRNATINDLNDRLITFYTVVRDHPRKLIEANRQHEHTEDYYYDARDRFNELHQFTEKTIPEQIEEASLLTFLNRTGYNGLYRENSNGEFNVPFGSHSNPDYVRRIAIMRASTLLSKSGITITNNDFESVEQHAESGDLVYLDPPYKPTSETADFTDYQADGFDKDDQERLRNLATRLDSMGVNVVISNSPAATELYHPLENFSTSKVTAKRSVGSNPDERDDVFEIIITNIPDENQQQQRLEHFS